MADESILHSLFLALPSLHELHAPGSSAFNLLKRVARREVEERFQNASAEPREFQPFGDLIFPYHDMGAVSSVNLFDMDELIIFSFYWVNRAKYRRVLDIGANIGLHSIILSKCGYDVRAYEPDPQHCAILQENLSLNRCKVEVHNAAISRSAGELEFVRVLGNTTGSHLAGSKANPYGPLERFPVKVEAFHDIVGWADLIKMDVEGHEKEIFLGTSHDNWVNTDALVEVGSGPNALAIYNHFRSIGVNLFAQKTSWHQVRSADDMPTSYKEGTLFVSCKNAMPW